MHNIGIFSSARFHCSEFWLRLRWGEPWFMQVKELTTLAVKLQDAVDRLQAQNQVSHLT
jgi:hypothetical protein